MDAPFAVLVKGLTSFTGFGFVVIWLAISRASLCRRQKSLPISRARPALTLKTSIGYIYLKIPTCRCIFNHLIYVFFFLKGVHTGLATEFRSKMKVLHSLSSHIPKPTLEMVTNKESNILKSDCILGVSDGKTICMFVLAQIETTDWS